MNVLKNWLEQARILRVERRAGQFALLDVFAMVTLASILLGMAVPFLHGRTTSERLTFLLIFLVQLSVTAGVAAKTIATRTTLLADAGGPLGLAFVSEVRWRSWPIFLNCAALLMLAIFQVGMALVISRFLQFEWNVPGRTTPTLLPAFVQLSIQFIQIPIILGKVSARFVQGAYPMLMEFFDHGIVFQEQYFPWPQVSVRPSQFFSDRIVVVVKERVEDRFGVLHTVAVSESLRQQVMQRAGGASITLVSQSGS